MSADFDDIFSLWCSLGDFAEDAGVTYGAAKQMRRRHSIPVRYWKNLIEGAARRGRTLTEVMLVEAHAQRAEHAA